jgi:hypothetical protein
MAISRFGGRHRNSQQTQRVGGGEKQLSTTRLVVAGDGQEECVLGSGWQLLKLLRVSTGVELAVLMDCEEGQEDIF